MERDPVCGMTVDPARAATADYAGSTYYLCSEGCAAKFRAAPDKYVRPGPTIQPPAHGGGLVRLVAAAPARRTAPGQSAVATEYTCPMHPEIIRPGPGSCPICGMALEPRTALAEDGPNEELVSMTRRLSVSVALAIPVVALGMSDIIPGRPLQGALTMRALGIIQFALATPVVLWAGWPFFQRFWTSLVNRSPNMFTLIGMGTGVAYGYSVVATLAPQIFTGQKTKHSHAVVDVHEHYAAIHERRVGITRLGASASRVAASVDPDHHGQRM